MAAERPLPPSRLKLPPWVLLGLIVILAGVALLLWRYGDKWTKPSRRPLPTKLAPCTADDSAGCLAAGQQFEARGLKGKAERAYGRCCSSERPSCCFNLGLLRWQRGAKALARAPLVKACGARHARGCTNLGVLLAEGKDRAGAERAFRTACDLGQALGCRNVAHGLLLSGDARGARFYADKSCRGGSALGCLARCHGVALAGGEALACYRALLRPAEGRRTLTRAVVLRELRRLSEARGSYRGTLGPIVGAL